MTLLLALACLAQEVSPDEAIKRIEESIEKAKTVSVKFKIDGHGAKEGPERDIKASGTLLLKEGNRVRLDLKVLAGGTEHEMVVVSDGSKLRSIRDGRDSESMESPKDLRSQLDAGLARTGSFLAVMFTTQRPEAKPVEQDPKKRLEIRDLKAGDGDARGKTLSYSVKFAGDSGSAEIKLSYDPKTWKPVKREITVKRNDEIQGTLTETYEEFAFDGEIPDAKFKVEDEKK